MSGFKIIPQYRENCVLHGTEVLLNDFQMGDTIFLISNSPTKTHSIITKIDGIEFSEDLKIFIDKRILENFAENDIVNVLKYNPAEAMEIRIHISNDFNLISRGDWTSNIKPSILNKIIDIGREINFIIPWNEDAPIVGNGIISFTLPNPPVFIGERTRIFIEKGDERTLTKIKSYALEHQKKRVEIIKKQIDRNILQLIKRIKQENYPSKGQKYNFKATNASLLFKSIIAVFKGLEAIEEPVEELQDSNQKNFLGSAVYFLEMESKSLFLIDVQLLAEDNTGTLMIWVTGENMTEINSILKKYDNRIIDLKKGIERNIEVLNIQCPECGADLPINKIDINGIVQCIYCNKISKVPKVLRY